MPRSRSLAHVAKSTFALALRRGPLLFVALVLLAARGRPCQAQGSPRYDCQIVSRDGGIIVLDCAPGYATGHDQVRIVAPLPSDWPGPDPETGLLPDIANGVVMLDVGADGSPNFVIVFSRQPDGASLAELYDDRDDDGQVAVSEIVGGGVRVQDRGPVVRVEAPDGWWQRDGLTNFNLDITIDGPVLGYFGTSAYLDWMPLDRQRDTLIHVRDRDADGRPDYEWRQIYLGFEEPAFYPHTQVMVNTEDDEQAIDGAVLWPYLGDALRDVNVFSKPSFGPSPPPIDVDWQASRITHVNEFVGSRTNAGNYFVYSFQRLEEGKISVPNYEAPFAYYDLSGEHRLVPNLMIRCVYHPTHDPFISALLQRPNAWPELGISYVWRYPTDQDEAAPAWDYKVTVLDSHEQEPIVDVGDLSIRIVGHAELPYWVTEKPWEFAAFVADEGAHIPNTEGLAPWGTSLEQLIPHSYRYLAGEVYRLPLTMFDNIAVRHRGEVAPTLRAPLQLYISGVDHKLHLLGSRFGVWNVDDKARLRYANLDGDGYLDQWRYYQEEQLLAELDLAQGLLVYGDDNSVLLRNASVPLSLFDTPPPRNHDEWLLLAQHLQEYQPSFSAGDLKAMMAQFAGPEWRVDAASMRAFRPDGEGFRFVLELGPGFEVSGSAGPALLGLGPGSYVVTYNGDFDVQSLTPGSPEVVPGSLRLSNPDPVALESVQIELLLQNAGLEDLPEQPVYLVTALPGSGSWVVGTSSVALLAGQPVPLRFEWSPPLVGDWRITVVVHVPGEGESATTQDLASFEVAVRPPSLPDMERTVLLSNLGAPKALLLLLASLSLAAVALVGLWIRNEERNG